jgi:hypothetical protein
VSGRQAPNEWASAQEHARWAADLVAPDPSVVWELKLRADGWGYGHSVRGRIVEVAVEFTKPMEARVRVELTEDAEPERIGYVTGDAVDVEVHEIEWIEAQR